MQITLKSWCRLSLLVLVLNVAGRSKAQSTVPPRIIAANVNVVAGPHSGTPLNTIGAGRAEEGLRADWQQQLAMLQQEVGFKYIRFHGIFHDDMGVYTEAVDGTPRYNFQYVDQLYDALLATHIRPFVELSFMPEKLASGTKTVFWWKANVTPPKDMNKWEGLIRAFVTHLEQRYGQDEVERWYFEVWNEPDYPAFWSGTQDQYFDLYLHTAKAVKEVCPACRVGGPASAFPAMVPPWLKFIEQTHAPADFVATHNYGVTQGAFDEDGNAGAILDPKPDSIVRAVKAASDAIAHSSQPNLELHFTEWSTSYTPTDYVHDQYISAPFILDKLKQTSPMTKSMSYWTFTDIFEEIGPRFTPFHGGFGLINYQGIRKPSYFAYKFLAALGAEDLRSDDPRSWVTVASDRSVQALFGDYTAVTPPTGLSDQIFFKREQPAHSVAPARLHLSGLQPGAYSVTVTRIGYRHNDAYTAYLEMDSPAQLTRLQTAALKLVASGDPEETHVVQIKAGEYDQTIPMNENDVVLVQFSPLGSGR